MPRVKKVVLVGSGASSSTPQLICLLGKTPCAQCIDAAANPKGKNNRLNPSMLIQVEEDEEEEAAVATPPPAADAAEKPKANEGDDDAKAPSSDAKKSAKVVRNILIDCGKTFREAALKVFHPLGVSNLAAVLITHAHADAFYGLDDIREFTGTSHAKVRTEVPVWTDESTQGDCRRVFPYLFAAKQQASWVAYLDWQVFKRFEAFTVCGIPVTALPVEHGKGYISNAFAFPLFEDKFMVYISDVSEIPDDTLKFIDSLKVEILLVDMLGPKDHYPTHFNIKEALAAAARINAKQTRFMGLGHGINGEEIDKQLVADGHSNWQTGFDGMVLFEAAEEGSKL